jgi:hypothetical protein
MEAQVVRGKGCIALMLMLSGIALIGLVALSLFVVFFVTGDGDTQISWVRVLLSTTALSIVGAILLWTGLRLLRQTRS